MTKLEEAQKERLRLLTDINNYSPNYYSAEYGDGLIKRLIKLNERIDKLTREYNKRFLTRKIKETDWAKTLVDKMAEHSLKSYYNYNNTLVDTSTHRIEIGYILPTKDGKLIGMYYVTPLCSHKRLSRDPHPLYDEFGNQVEIGYLYNRITKGKLLIHENTDATVTGFLKIFAEEFGVEPKLVAVENKQYADILRIIK